MKYPMLKFLLMLLIAGGTREPSLAPDGEQMVIRAYLYAGEKVEDIQITTSLPLGSKKTQAPPVNDATVELIKGDALSAGVERRRQRVRSLCG